MSSRRVSLPVALHTLNTPQTIYSGVSRLSPPSPHSARRSSNFVGSPPSSGPNYGHRRSLPGTPHQRTRHRVLPHLDEDQGSSSSSDNSPRHPSRPTNLARRYKYSLQDGDFMETNNNIRVKDGLDGLGPIEGKLRSFGYKHGSLVDNGYELKGLGKAVARNRGENRRATCPEIYLYPEPSLPTRHIVLRLYGGRNTGKKTLAHQIYHVASSTTPDQTHVISSESEQTASKTINFLLNGEEIQMEIVIESTLESAPFSNHLTMYVVVYSVDSRESFKRAANLLYRIYQNRSTYTVPVVLIGNKIDLKRHTTISTLEGRSLAKIYKCSFVEVSALLSMNTDAMWTELIKQLQDPTENQPTPDPSWMQRLVSRGRHIAKSCEEIVQRLIAA
ncbi:unnamed protein product [Cylicocyclus nassatus]|uniref:Uncharacterized protein n=1 Tax=Cylicocyclus nassatus TaxID=53992 RepID=A0AA36H9D7_CYLNA|nr:unnamed protein product [Cylicocyclus nassatus]